MMQAMILDNATFKEVGVVGLLRKDVKRMLDLGTVCLIPLKASIHRGEHVVCCVDEESEFNTKVEVIAKQLGFESADVFVHDNGPWPGWRRRTDADKSA